MPNNMLGIKDKYINIFIVDDDKLMLKILSHKFKTTTNYNIYTFINGEDFLNFLNRNKFHKKSISLLILDYQLQTGGNKARNGIEILKFVKELYPDMHIIMHSSTEDINIHSKAIELGAKTFIKKNENSFLRINNQLQSIISDTIIERKRNTSIKTQYIFLGVLFLFVLMMIVHFIVD